MKSLQIGSVFLAAAALAMAQPVVTSIENAAGNVPAPLPNAPIAQGAMFVVKGVNLGPANDVVPGAFPFATSLAGVSIKVTVAGQTKDAIMRYTVTLPPERLPLNRQLAAILPSSTPLGTGTLTVMYNGQASAPAPVTVVASNIGLYTANYSGSGAAVTYFQIPPAGGALVSNGNAAIANDSIIFWGTGLGAINADETVAAPGGDMPNVPLEVFIGGQPAEVLYRGRNACCTATDAIYVRIPIGVSGCVTPVSMKIGNLVSNTVTIPIATTGRTCTPSNPAISQSDLEGILARGSYTYGNILLTRESSAKSDTGSAVFSRVSGDISAAFNTQFENVNFGACAVYSYTGQTLPVVNLTTTTLDAGLSIDVNGAKGPKKIAKQPGGSYFATLSATADYLDPGTYTVTGPGGANVPIFSVQTTVPPTLVWTNQANVATVTRANGLPITWTGGDPNGIVQISGSSFVPVGVSSFVSSSFICTAKTSAGSFTVPSVVLLALPPSGSINIGGGISIPLLGSLAVSSVTSTTATHSGLDFFSVGSQVTISQSTTYQ